MSKKAKHSSVCKHSKKLIKKLEAINEVTKVVIGLSTCCRHSFSPGKAKVQEIGPAGFRLNLYGGNGITSVFIVVEPENQASVLEKLSDFIVTKEEKENAKDVVPTKRKKQVDSSRTKKS